MRDAGGGPGNVHGRGWRTEVVISTGWTREGGRQTEVSARRRARRGKGGQKCRHGSGHEKTEGRQMSGVTDRQAGPTV